MKLFSSLSFFGDPLKVAKKLLGSENVLSAKDVTKLIGLRKAPDCPVPYSQKTLEWCAQENKGGEQWKLSFKLGVSLAELHRLKPDEFCNATVWHLLPPWVTTICQPGYRLINFKLRYDAGTPPPSDFVWFAPAQVQTVAEALIAIRLKNGKKSVRLLTDEYHGGGDYHGITPIVGGYDDKGMLVYTLPTEIMHDLLVLRQVGMMCCIAPETPNHHPTKPAP